MGGVGSGLYTRIGAKNTTDQYKSIDVRLWSREGLLLPGTSFISAWKSHNHYVGSVAVEVRHGNLALAFLGHHGEQQSQVIWLTRTHCNYGQSRIWFVCPTRDCNKRVAILYAAERFACRNCMKLVYLSQRESATDRDRRRAQNIRIRLGGGANISEAFPEKPKWMRWRTYLELKVSARLHELRSIVNLRVRGIKIY